MREQGCPAKAGGRNRPADCSPALAGELWSRRALVVQTMALAAFPASAAKPPPMPKTANIHWPGPAGELHGYMAIPAKARGRQPAVMVVHDAGGADTFTRGLTDQLAQAGFVTCQPNRLASLEDAAATVKWLATNAYATGKVGAIGIGWGGALVERVAASQPLLTAGVVFGAQDSVPIDRPTPLLRLEALRDYTGEAYVSAWAQAIAFLKTNLG